MSTCVRYERQRPRYCTPCYTTDSKDLHSEASMYVLSLYLKHYISIFSRHDFQTSDSLTRHSKVRHHPVSRSHGSVLNGVRLRQLSVLVSGYDRMMSVGAGHWITCWRSGVPIIGARLVATAGKVSADRGQTKVRDWW